MQELRIEIKSQNTKTITANIVSSPVKAELIHYTAYMVIGSFTCPEYTGEALYIWGDDPARNLEDILIPVKEYPKVLAAIAEFNAYYATLDDAQAFERRGTIKGYQVCCNHFWIDKKECSCNRGICAICGAEHPAEDMRLVSRGSEKVRICMSHKKTKVCAVCGSKEYLLTNHMSRPLDVCFSCSTKEIPWGEQKNYSYKPAPLFHDISPSGNKVIYTQTQLKNNARLKTKFFMGHEVEQLFEESANRNLIIGVMENKLPDFVYCKSDSSIGSYGTEAVTHPFSWEYFKNIDLSAIINDRLTDWRKAGLPVGHHVHVALSSFSHVHLYRFLKFHHTHLKYVEFVSQRALQTYCKQTGGSLTKSINKLGHDRYDFINLSNGQTLEWRAFASPISYEEFCKNTEYLYAAYTWTKTADPKNLDSVAFENYVLSSANLYPNLVNYLRKSDAQNNSDYRNRHQVNKEYDHASLGTPIKKEANTVSSVSSTSYCAFCGDFLGTDKVVVTRSTNQSSLILCPSCAKKKSWTCSCCGKKFMGEKDYDSFDKPICKSCSIDAVLKEAEAPENFLDIQTLRTASSNSAASLSMVDVDDIDYDDSDDDDSDDDDF